MLRPQRVCLGSVIEGFEDGVIGCWSIWSFGGTDLEAFDGDWV